MSDLAKTGDHWNERYRLWAAGSLTTCLALLLSSCQKPAAPEPSHVEVQSTVHSVAFSPDGHCLASGGTVTKLWDLQGGGKPRPLSGNATGGYSVTFSRDGRMLAATDTNIDAIGIKGTINLWDVATGQLARVLGCDKREINSIAFSPDGRLLASGDDDKTVNVWDVSTGQLLRTLFGHTHVVTSVSFSADGRTIAGGSYDGIIKIWDASTGALKREIVVANASETRPATVLCVAFSPDGRYLASALRTQVQLWDPNSGREVRRFATGHSEDITSLAFSSDGKTLVTGSRDQSIKLWDVNSGKLLQTLSGAGSVVSSVALSSDGHRLAGGGQDNIVTLWDLSSGKQLQRLQWHLFLDGHGSTDL